MVLLGKAPHTGYQIYTGYKVYKWGLGAFSREMAGIQVLLQGLDTRYPIGGRRGRLWGAGGCGCKLFEKHGL